MSDRNRVLEALEALRIARKLVRRARDRSPHDDDLERVWRELRKARDALREEAIALAPAPSPGQVHPWPWQPSVGEDASLPSP
jgi:hypothetical protein